MRSRLLRPDRLDVDAFAAAGGELAGERALTDWPRLADVLRPPPGDPDMRVRWSARGEQRKVRFGPPQSWLHLHGEVRGEMTCQRCLEPVPVTLAIDRLFRFVGSEAAAAEEDDASEEDVLVGSTAFDLVGLVEDELVLALPYAPRHDICPMPSPADDAAADAEPPSVMDPPGAAHRPSPFAVLAELGSRPPAASGGQAPSGGDAPPPKRPSDRSMP
jgi:uncharacterized protein